jgi:hypothetical protein
LEAKISTMAVNIAPTNAAAMSFCASQMSPYGIRNSAHDRLGQREPTDKNNQQNILQHPRLPIQWVNRRDDPDRRANRD